MNDASEIEDDTAEEPKNEVGSVASDPLKLGMENISETYKIRGIPHYWKSGHLESFLEKLGIKVTFITKRVPSYTAILRFPNKDEKVKAFKILTTFSDETIPIKRINCTEIPNKKHKQSEKVRKKKNKNNDNRNQSNDNNKNKNKNKKKNNSKKDKRNRDGMNSSNDKNRDILDVVMPLHKLEYSKQLEVKFGEITRNSRWFHRRMTDRYKMNLDYLKWIKLLKMNNNLKNMFKIEGILSSPVLVNYRNKASFSIGYSFHKNNNNNKNKNTHVSNSNSNSGKQIESNINNKEEEEQEEEEDDDIDISMNGKNQETKKQETEKEKTNINENDNEQKKKKEKSNEISSLNEDELDKLLFDKISIGFQFGRFENNNETKISIERCDNRHIHCHPVSIRVANEIEIFFKQLCQIKHENKTENNDIGNNEEKTKDKAIEKKNNDDNNDRKKMENRKYTYRVYDKFTHSGELRKLIVRTSHRSKQCMFVCIVLCKDIR